MQFPTLTVPEALANLGQTAPASRGFTFVGEDGTSERYFSFSDLSVEVARRARSLQRLGLKAGDHVVIAVPDSEGFVVTFLGAMHAGLVPVPIYPPLSLGKLGSYLEHSRHIIERSKAQVAITTAQIRRVLGSLLGNPLRQIAIVEELSQESEAAALVRRNLSDAGFIQFTSGSTSRPKGVVLTHGNLATNAHCIMNLGLKVTPEDRGCTWLPFYHDMGLIGFVLSPLYTSTPVAFISPLLFLKRPAEWLRLVSRHKGSISFGPNFAYGLATNRIKDQQLEGVDLSTWRIAGCGAEPIQLDTLMAFAKRFAAWGFRSEALMPAYGMAEATLAVSFWDITRTPVADSVHLSLLSAEHKASPVSDDSTDRVDVVNCGKPFEGHELAILDENGEPLPDRRVGQIALRGPSVMQGYYDDPDATGEALRAGWLHTGDLGYLAAGELHVCGRIKDLIIIGGKNFYPTDIEWAASEVEGVRRGNVVAFGLPPAGGGQERVVICAETKEDSAAWPQIAHAVVAQVTSSVGVKPDEVVLLEPGSLPKTSSGKLQRRKAKQMFLDGELHGAHKPEGRLDLVKHLAKSQWGLIKKRVQSAVKPD